MGELKEDIKKNKQKRDLKILISLGVTALVLLVASLIIVFSSNSVSTPNADEAKQSVEGNEEVTLIEEDTKLEEVAGNKEGETTEETNEDITDVPTSNDAPSVPAQKTVDEEKGVNADSSKSFENDRMRITYEVPQAWKNLVKVYDEGDVIKFVYKEKAQFLTIRAMTENQYNADKEFYDSFYNLVLKNGNVLILYTLPNEHPLAHEEGSADFKELNGVMSDNYNLIKTIKAK